MKLKERKREKRFKERENIRKDFKKGRSYKKWLEEKLLVIDHTESRNRGIMHIRKRNIKMCTNDPGAQ